MVQPYRTFGSFILFKESRHDELGHLYRAGEFDAGGIRRKVWLRVFDGPGVPGDDVRSRFEMARQIGSVLRAANAVTNPAHIELGGVPALAFDHVPSQPLGSVLDKVRAEGFPVPVDNALLILEKLSLGLSAALAVEVGGSSLVHGFLHPGLIQVTNDGEGLIMGFGFADQLLGLLDHAEVAAAVQPYLAPEVLVSRNTSKRGDVYSLGAILYELLTGQPLPSAPEARKGILDRAELAYDDQPVPDDIKVLLGRALAARPEDRFSSAADFKKELDKLLYGGAYSPTTFNLALFMDRLFRNEIEAEEREIGDEAKVDVTPYLAPEPEPEPVEAEPPPPSPGGSKGLWVGIAGAAVVVAAIALVMTLNRGPAVPPPPPTPTAEELAERQRVEDERLQAMIQDMVQQRMAEKEEEIRQELLARQSQIEDLRRRLTESEQRGKSGQLSETERRAQAELQQQIAAAEAQQRQQEEALEQERVRVAEEERLRVAAQRATATAGAAAEAERVAAAAIPTATPPASAVAAAPTPAPTPELVAEKPPATAAVAAVTVTEGMFVDPSEVDSAPVVLRESPVSWSRVATMSRRRGMIIMQVMVNAGGGVDDVRVLRADDEGFGIPEAVMEAVRKYRFKPGTKDGVKVTTTVTVTMRYNFLER